MTQAYSDQCGCACCRGKRELVDRLAKKIAEALKCSAHRPVQHRDGKPPWCKGCGHE